MAEIQHDLAFEWYFTGSGPSMSYSKGSRIIPYYFRKSDSRAPRSFWKGFDPSGLISRIIMEVEPHLDLATFTPLKVFLRSRLLSRGVSMCVVY